MEEKELVPVDRDGRLEAKLKTILHTENITSVRLSDVPRDDLVPALYYILDVIYSLQQKYTEFEEIEGKLEHISKHGLSEGKENINKLEKDIEEQEKPSRKRKKKQTQPRASFRVW